MFGFLVSAVQAELAAVDSPGQYQPATFALSMSVTQLTPATVCKIGQNFLPYVRRGLRPL